MEADRVSDLIPFLHVTLGPHRTTESPNADGQPATSDPSELH
jgi:hypothetical protein